MIDEFQVGRAPVMLCMSLALGVGGIIAPAIGKAMDRWSGRGVVILGILLVSASCLVTASASRLWIIQLTWGTIMPVGTMMTGPLMGQALASQWFKKRRGFAVGLTLAGIGIGGAVLPPVVNALIMAHGWRQAFIILAIANLLVLLPLATAFIRNPPKGIDIDVDTASTASGTTSQPSGTIWTTRAILKSRAYWMLILGFIPVLTMAVAFQHNLGGIGGDAGLSASTIAYLVSAFSLSLAAGKVFFGFTSDSLPAKALYGLAIMLFLTAIFLINIPNSTVYLSLGVILFGFAFGSYFPLLGAFLLRQFEAENIGTALGLVCFFGVFTSAGPLAISGIRDATGSYAAGYALMASMMVIASVSIALLRMAPKQPVVESADG